jgi:hypothetical protein
MKRAIEDLLDDTSDRAALDEINRELERRFDASAKPANLGGFSSIEQSTIDLSGVLGEINEAALDWLSIESIGVISEYEYWVHQRTPAPTEAWARLLAGILIDPRCAWPCGLWAISPESMRTADGPSQRWIKTGQREELISLYPSAGELPWLRGGPFAQNLPYGPLIAWKHPLDFPEVPDRLLRRIQAARLIRRPDPYMQGRYSSEAGAQCEELRINMNFYSDLDQRPPGEVIIEAANNALSFGGAIARGRPDRVAAHDLKQAAIHAEDDTP